MRVADRNRKRIRRVRPDRQALQSACDALVQGFDFADALHHASSRHGDVFVTFDEKGFAKRASAHGWAPKVQLP